MKQPGRFILFAFLLATYLHAGDSKDPSFDCSKASGEIEKLICKDESLAALDRKMAEVFAEAMGKWPSEEASKQKIMQLGWIKGRNDCWKEKDQRACVETEYKTRLVEIQIKSGQLMVPDAVGYNCEGNKEKSFTAVFYNETDPKSAVLTFGDNYVIAFIQPAASGAKYSAQNVEFWEHQGEAAVKWFGTNLKCIAIASSSNE